MRRSVGLVMAIMFIAACGDDPSLQIEVHQPTNESYKRLITKTEVTVYESDLDTLTCEQIEFGDVTQDLLLGAAVAQQTAFKDGHVEGTLDDISRLGKKVVVARMLTDTDVLIAAGCAEQGDLDGKTKLVIETVVAASVTVDAINTEDPYGKQITMVDPLGDSLVDREVRWRLFAPAGAVPAAGGVTVDPAEPTIWSSASPSCSDNRGIATMRLTPPTKVAGFAARFRVSWPATPIDVLSGFVRPGIGLQLLTNPTLSNRCAVRTVGERRVVCVESVTAAAGTAHRYEVTQGPLKNYNITDRGTAAITGRPAGAIAIDEAGGKEVYALTENGQLHKLFGATTPPTTTGCTNCTIDDLRVAPACGDDEAKLIMHSTTGSPIRGMLLAGALAGQVTDFGLVVDAGVSVNLNAVGCVTTINAQGNEKDVQVVVLDLSTSDGVITRGFFKCGPGRICNVPLPFPTGGVGFVQAGTATKPEHQMVGTAFDIAGAELVGWVLRPTFDGATYLLIDRQRIVAAAPPVQVLVGRLDSDDQPDLVWNMRGTRSTLLQVSYGHTIEDGSRLSALAPLPTTVAIDEILLGDVTGDGFDDLIGVTPGSFVVLPQNVDGPAVPDRTTESTCAP